MFKKLVLGSFLAVSVSIAGDVQGFLNALGVSLSSPKSIETQNRGFAFGGGVSYRYSTTAINPVRIVPPSLNAGCGGIDLALGSFSYLKPDYFIKVGQKIISDSPGYAFTIGLDILCPQCSSLMNTLTGLVNQINSMSLDSCQIFNNLRNKIKSKVMEKRLEGSGESWIEATSKTFSNWSDTLAEFNNYLSNIGCTDPNCYLFAGYNSLAERFVNETNQSYWRTSEGRYIARAVFGDLIKRGSQNYICVKPREGNDLIRDVLSLAKDTTTSFIGIDDSGNLRVMSLTTFRSYVRGELDRIVNRIINKQPLTSADLEFLARYDIPAMSLLRSFAPYPSALLTIKSYLEEYLAYELVYQFFLSLYADYTRMIAKARSMEKTSPDMPERAVECLEEIMEMEVPERAMAYLAEGVKEKKKNLVERIKLAIDIAELERMVYSKFSRHPLMSSYIFGNAVK